MNLWHNAKITLTRQGPDELEEVRLPDIDDPEVEHLWGYRWTPGPDETIDLSQYVRTIRIEAPEDEQEPA